MVSIVGVMNMMLQMPPSGSDARSLMYGQMAIVAMLVLAVAAIFAFTENRVTKVVDARLNDPNSEFSKHRIDANAHPQMRERMTEQLRADLKEINQSIRAVEREHRDSLSRIGEQVVKPVLEQNGRTLGLLEKAMERTRHYDKEDRAVTFGPSD